MTFGNTIVSTSRPLGGAFDFFSSGSKINANASKITRPVVSMPSRGDFGGGVAAPTVAGPNRGDYGSPNMDAVKQLGADSRRFGAEYRNPTKTGAFQNLMRLANEQTAAQEDEVARGARDAASRAGYAGGFSARNAQVRRDRMRALSTAGFEGAAKIREEALSGYTAASGAFAKAMGDFNQAQTASNLAFANDAHDTRVKNAQLGLDAAQINQRAQEAWATAKSQHQQLQAQLDSAFNNQLIDAGRYEQMSRSLQAQLVMEQLRLQEQARQFNVARNDDVLERARLRKERGVDPLTGKKYGPANFDKANSPFDAVMNRR